MPPTEGDPTRRLVIEAVRRVLEEMTRLLASLEGPGPAAPNVAPQPQRGATRGRPRGSPLDAEILHLLRRGEVMKGSLIALRLRREYSHVRRRLAVLLGQGKIRHVRGEGYALAE